MMSKFLFGSLCALALSTSAYAQENGDVMVSNAIGFLDIPYVAHTLDLDDDKEELTINCDEVDCTTLVEYVLAMSISPTEDGQVAEGDFADNLQKIRYRDGKVDGYTSRLHYITDWANNGIRNGFLEDITEKNSPYVKKVSVNYMSTHPEQYRQLAHSAENVAKMKEIEKNLSQGEIHYIPMENLPYNGLPWIKNGDIIAFVTNIPGLDVAHMGIAFYVEGKLSLIHASSSSKKVVVSRVALTQMMKSNDKWIGIRVLRMKK